MRNSWMKQFWKKADLLRSDLLGSLSDTVSGPSRQAVIFDVLQIFGGIALFLIFATLSRYLYWWMDLALLAGTAVFTISTPLECRYRLLLTTAFLLSSFYFFLGQPLLAPLGWLVGGLSLTLIVYEWKYPSGRTLVWLFLLGTAVSALIMTASALFLLPYVHPYTTMLVGWMPAVWVVLTVLLAAIASLRQRSGEDSSEWLVAPTMWVLFAVYWGPGTAIGLLVLALILVIQSAVSFAKRTTYETNNRSHGGFKLTVVFAAIWLALIGTSNSLGWLYDLEMANYKEVREIKTLPVSEVTRMVPMSAAPDYCRQLHRTPNTVISREPTLLVVSEGGINKMYWQCLRHPDRFLGHEFLYMTGGIEGFVVADAGEFGPAGKPVHVDFIFGDQSTAVEAAFNVRHPGSEMQKAVVAKARHGGYHMLITYTTRVMNTGGAILPDAVGVMEVSPLGFIRDLTLSQAAEQYPGVPIFPASISRLYAEAWGRAPSLMAVIRTGEQFKISEARGDGNKYPFFETFRDGLKGVVPFETVGNDQKQLTAFVFTDPVRSDMEIFRFPEERSGDIATKSGESQNPVGPAHIVSRIYLSHPGMFNVRTTEALPIFTEDHRVYWLTAMMQDQKQADGTVSSSYSRSVLYTGNGNRFWDVRSVQEVIASMKPGLASQKPQEN